MTSEVAQECILEERERENEAKGLCKGVIDDLVEAAVDYGERRKVENVSDEKT